MNYKVTRGGIILFIVTVFLGFLLTKQIDAKIRVDKVNNPKNISDIAAQVVQVINGNSRLRQDLAQLNIQKAILLNDSTSKSASDEAVTKEINQLKVITGQTDISGPGVEIRFTSALQLTDIVDLVNSLRNVGAEAIMINDNRIIANTAFYENMGRAPVMIKAIGDKKVLADSLERSGGIISQVNAGGKVTQKDKIDIAKVKGN